MRTDIQKLLNTENPPKEPATFYGALATLVVSVVGLALNYLFPHMSEHTQYTIMTALAVFVPVAVGILIRFKVWSPATVQKVVEEIQNDYNIIKGELDPPSDKPPAPKLI